MTDLTDRTTRDLLAFVEIPSYHGHPNGVRQAAAFLGEQLQAVGFDVETVGSHASPYLIGRLSGDPDRLLVIYLMYDVRAPTAVPPEPAGIRRLPGLGRVLWSPLPVGNKAAAVTFLAALGRARKRLRLPSVLVVAEGVETLGSPGFEHLIRDSRGTLFRRAEAAFWPRESQDASGRAHLHLGYRGMLGIRLTLSGARSGWGPGVRAIHSQYRPWVDAPTWRLVEVLSFLRQAEGWASVNPGPKGDWSAVEQAYDPTTVLADLGVIGRPVEEPQTLLEGLECRASLNLEFEASLSPGVGQIQAVASARLQFRLPPRVEWIALVDRITRELEAAGFGDADVEVLYAMNGALLDPSSRPVRALAQAYSDIGVPIVRWPVGLSTSPIVTFHSQLGIPVADGGLGRLEPVAGGEAVVGPGIARTVTNRIQFYERILTQLADSGPRQNSALPPAAVEPR